MNHMSTLSHVTTSATHFILIHEMLIMATPLKGVSTGRLSCSRSFFFTLVTVAKGKMLICFGMRRLSCGKGRGGGVI